jgi:hypothetical protein
MPAASSASPRSKLIHRFPSGRPASPRNASGMRMYIVEPSIRISMVPSPSPGRSDDMSIVIEPSTSSYAKMPSPLNDIFSPAAFIVV